MSLKEAKLFQVHRKSDYPPMADQLKAVFNQLLELRKSKGQQVRKANRVRQTMDAIILDCWIAANYCESPYRAVSRNKSDYQKGTRYRKLFFKYDLFIGVLNDLIELGYIFQKIGFQDRRSGIGYQTRIKLTDQLLNFLDFDIKQIERNPEAPENETIILKGADGELLDYVDDRFTNEMREDVRQYNNMIRKAEIDTDAVELRYKYDPTNVFLKRVFNGEDWDGGGRFYGYWQQLSKEERLKLKLDGESVVEKDYVALHPTIAYSLIGYELAFDPYTIEGCERDDVKKAFLCLFNCESRKQAIVDSTGQCNASFSTWAGVLKSKVFLGREFSFPATSFS